MAHFSIKLYYHYGSFILFLYVLLSLIMKAKWILNQVQSSMYESDSMASCHLYEINSTTLVVIFFINSWHQLNFIQHQHLSVEAKFFTQRPWTTDIHAVRKTASSAMILPYQQTTWAIEQYHQLSKVRNLKFCPCIIVTGAHVESRWCFVHLLAARSVQIENLIKMCHFTEFQR